MTDEDRIRSLLSLAADLPDDVQAPVGGLLGRGRSRRRLRAVGCVAAAAVVAAVAFTLPAVLRPPGSGGPNRVRQGGFLATGPTAAQLARYHWSQLPPSPLGPRAHPHLAWTGRYLIELAGPVKGHAAATGVAYDTVTSRWHRIAPPPNSVVMGNPATVWTGRQLFVTSNRIPPFWVLGVGAPAGLYHPATNHWTATDMPPQLLSASSISAAWTGRDVIVAGVGSHARLRVASYDLATRRWTMITPKLPAGHSPQSLTMLATPGRVLLWSFWWRARITSKTSARSLAGVDVLALARGGNWSNVTDRWPQDQTVQSPSYAGGRIFYTSSFWCHACSPPAQLLQQRLADAATLRPETIRPGPLTSAGIWLWNGATVVALDRSANGKPAIAAYDPQAKSWHLLPAPPPDRITTAVWAGRKLLALTSAGALLAFHR